MRLATLWIAQAILVRSFESSQASQDEYVRASTIRMRSRDVPACLRPCIHTVPCK